MSESWYSRPQLLQTAKILLVYILFFLALLGAALIVEQMEGGPATKTDTFPEPY